MTILKTKPKIPTRLQRITFSKKLAKQMNAVYKHAGWHERAGECCSAAEEPLADHTIKTAAVCEWYCKVTLLTAELVNVKVCYRLTGMSGYSHMDITAPADDHIHIADTVRLLKLFAKEAIQSGMRTLDRERV